MSTTLRVLDVRHLRTPEQRAGVVYVGRRFAGWSPHPLANPFRVRPHDRNADRGTTTRTVDDALTRYAEWVVRHPDLDRLLAELWAATDGGRLPLGCWCITADFDPAAPVVCHAQILAGLLLGRFGRSGGEK